MLIDAFFYALLPSPSLLLSAHHRPQKPTPSAPLVAFATGGLVDIVDPEITGSLTDPFDPLSLAASIRWVLEDPQRRRQLGAAPRQRAERLWDPAQVAGLYAEVVGQAVQRGFQTRSGSPSLR